MKTYEETVEERRAESEWECLKAMARIEAAKIEAEKGRRIGERSGTMVANPVAESGSRIGSTPSTAREAQEFQDNERRRRASGQCPFAILDEDYQEVVSKAEKKRRKEAAVGKVEKKEAEKVGHLRPLATVEPEGVRALGDGEWEEIDLAVDRAATETVVG